MEEIKIINPHQDKRWDDFVATHPCGWIVHTSGWKKVIEQTFPHIKGHHPALIDTETNEIKAGLPIYEIRSWLTGNRLVSIPFATLSDPLVSTRQQSDALLQSAIELQEHLGFSYIEIRTLGLNQLIDSSFRSNKDYKNHYLELAVGPEEIWKHIRYKSIRYLINKANKNKLALKVASGEGDFQSFYQLYAATRMRLGLPAQPYLFFKAIYDIFTPSGNVVILLALSGEKIIAGHLLFKFNGRVSVEAVGEDAGSRHLYANHFLYWEGIKSACAEGHKIFDFGRTSVYNTTLIDFKKHWGTKEAYIYTLFYDKGRKVMGANTRETSLPYSIMRFMCQKTPGALQPILSRFCYRHLG